MKFAKEGRSGDERSRRSLMKGFLEGSGTTWRAQLRGVAFETTCWGGLRRGRKVGGKLGVRVLKILFRCDWGEDILERWKFKKIGFGALK